MQTFSEPVLVEDPSRIPSPDPSQNGRGEKSSSPWRGRLGGGETGLLSAYRATHATTRWKLILRIVDMDASSSSFQEVRRVT